MISPRADATATEPSSSPGPLIRVRGARTHNLKDIDVDLPRNRLIVITGPSGSGKSSLAFDTLYAEGKRQYIESLSVYARQFIEKIPRPDVDWIEGLQPTLCIDQRVGNLNPRSTVATITEVHDYLRVLMARLGAAHCTQCGRRIRPYSLAEITERLLQLPEGTRGVILAPRIRNQTGPHTEVLESIRKAGFVRVRIDGSVVELDRIPPMSPDRPHTIEAVIDRIVVRANSATRITDSLRLAIEHSGGFVTILYADESEEIESWRDEFYSTRQACPDCNLSFPEFEPRSFSFNSPLGACPRCDGLGQREIFDPNLVIPDRELSFDRHGIRCWRGKAAPPPEMLAMVADFLRDEGVSAADAFAVLTSEQWHRLWEGDATYPGLHSLLEKQWATTTTREALTILSACRATTLCSLCGGMRLRRESLQVRLGGLNIYEIGELSIAAARRFLSELEFDETRAPIAEPLVHGIATRLHFLEKVGVQYLTLNRSVRSLSGGEFQRVRLASSLGSGLVGVCYVLDEPSIGLHPRDTTRLIETLRELKDQGNTVVLVEHEEQLIRVADWLVDLGPGAGSRGGRVTAVGPLADVLSHPDSLTGAYLAGRQAIPIPMERRSPVKQRSLQLLGVSTHNLKEVDLELPLGLLVGITGVSGSGKSSLIEHTLYPAVARRLKLVAPEPGPHRGLRGISKLKRLVHIDQSPLGLSSRGNVATYSGVFDEIRRLFASTPEAKQRGFRLGRFSFNNAGGRCEACQGHGVQRIEMSFLPDVFVECESCRGARFNQQTLDIRYRQRSIADVLHLSLDEALEFFSEVETIGRMLRSLCEIGLGYLTLGQPAITFSGGESQRVKLATELARRDLSDTLYLLDEPTTGLHLDDVRRLLAVLHQLVDQGHSVVIVEHNPEVIKCCDWLVDLGPEGGERGGEIVAAGTPEQVAAHPTSHTGSFLREVLPRPRDGNDRAP